jgi:predicted membrane-bound spermidine synthase
MFGNLVAFAAQRVAGRAVDAMERRLVWGGFGAVLSLAALVFLLVAGFVYLQREFGTLSTAAIMAGSCALLGLLGFSMPSVLNWLERQAERDKDPVSRIADEVDEEAHAAVDYLGPIQVAVSAFMLGLSAARGLRGK